MKIPKYIQEIMDRSSYEISRDDIGHTIRIKKTTAYTHINTFRKEVERLVAWCNKFPHHADLPLCKIDKIGDHTIYDTQYAWVTIYDPVMKWLDEYIGM